ncbi:MAG: cytidylate kinase family protein [Bdellovibrionales bacterium]
MNKRPNLITVTGQPGAGKTTMCKKLAEELGWEYFYTGMVMRKLAEDRGISITEINKLAETDRSFDKIVDSVYLDISKSDKPHIIDARLAWYFLPDSFKVMFEVPLSIGAQRVMAADKRVSESYRDLPSAMHSMKVRREAERTKHRNSYGIENDGDLNHFDLVLDTAYSSPDRNVSFVRAAFSLWQKGIRLPKVWMSPKSLYPTHDVAKMSEPQVEHLSKKFAEYGYDTIEPLMTAVYGDQVHIIDGHHRAAAAIHAGCDFIPVILLQDGDTLLGGKTVEVYLRSHVTAELLAAWENKHGFMFSMPSTMTSAA